MKKKFWTKRKFIILLVVVGIIALLGFLQARNLRQSVLDSTQTTTIQKGTISLVSIATGKLSSSEEDHLKLVGTVSNLFVELGDTVKKGDHLGEYVKQSAVAQDLYSPVSGIVTKLPSALDNRFEIADANTLAMEVLIPETLINKVTVGQSSEVYVNAVDKTYYGSVKSKDASKNAAGLYPVSVELNRYDGSVLVGMSGVAKLNIESYGDFYYHGLVSYGNAKTLTIDGTILSTEVELGQSVKAKQKLGSYQARSTNSLIIASKDGVVSALPSALANEIVISDPKALQLVVNISETDIHKLKLDQSATISIEAIHQSFEGKVVRIGQIGNTNLDYTTYPVTIEFDAKDAPLFLGMSGSATIVVESKSDILVIPYEALVADGTNRYVISSDWLKSPSKPQSDFYIPVTTGIADLYTIEVSGDGLEGKEIVIPKSSSTFQLFQRP